VKRSAEYDADLREGWASSPLGDLVAMKYGKSLVQERRRSGTVPVYGSNGVVGRHDEALTDGPTIVVGRKGSVGEVHLSTGGCWPIDTTYFIDEFGPFECAYLTYTLKALRLGDLDQSTAIPGLSREQAYAAQLPIPPIPEQKRIVAKVEELLGRVHAARARLAKVPAILKRFRQAILAAACSGQLTGDWRGDEGSNGDDVPDGWVDTTVEGACQIIADCPHSTPKWTNEGVICLRTTNFSAGRLDLGKVRYVSEATYKERVNRVEPAAGDVLYSREGGILGIACMMPNRLRACLGQRMMLMRPGSGLLPAYLMHALNSPATLANVRDLTGGTASPHLNVGDVKAFRLCLPPRDEQTEIVRRVEALFGLADKIEARVRAATARVEKITQAILAKAFRGELVPTEAELARQEGRDYEPASVLLERIKAQKRAAPQGPLPSRAKRGMPKKRK